MYLRFTSKVHLKSKYLLTLSAYFQVTHQYLAQGYRYDTDLKHTY